MSAITLRSPRSTPGPPRPAPRRFRTVVVVALTLLIIAWSVLPFLWLFRSSLSPVSELTRVPPQWWPQAVTFENYRALAESIVYAGQGQSIAQLVGLGFQNSLLVCSVVTVLNLVLGTMAAYGFSRMRNPLMDKIFSSLLVARMIPPFAVIIPLFVLFSQLKLYDTYQGLILAELSATVPFSVWIIRNYLDTLGQELDEQARIDGASRLQTLRHVIVPVARPALVSAAIFAFLLSWNSFLFPLVLSSSPEIMTVQPQIAAAYGDMRAEYGILFASTVVASLPPIFIAVVLQRFLSQGLTSGSVKG